MTVFLWLSFSLPKIASEQHQGTLNVLEAEPTTKLAWSLQCVAIMRPAHPTIELLASPRNHNLIVGHTSPPGWKDHWVRNVPVVGPYLNLLYEIMYYTTSLEDVADFIAADLESGSQDWIGKKVGAKEKIRGA